MDHRISKDMISSGMTPSGEKAQEDLGRTQYGSTPSPSSLMEAYKTMYEHHQKDADGKVIEHEEEEVKEGKMPEGLKNYLMKKGKKEDKKDDMKKEDIDLFDLIKSAFIEEGYNESDALAFMVEASQEYLTELDRELTMLSVAGAAAIPAIAKRIFKPKVDKTIDTKRKTLDIGGDKRSGVGMKEGVFADPKLNKKYPDQPKMTEKGKKILPNLPDPEGLGSRKTSKPAFGISKSTNDALKMLK